MIRPGLERISRLLARTPLPWPAIHVAGTNGKGSICAYITAMLNVYNQSSYVRQAKLPKLRHGRFTSPHLIDRWDCISIDGEPINDEFFKAVEAAVFRRDRDEGIAASEFEILTATAFEIFNREKIDVGVVEVGMGGAEDATNIIGQPAAGGAGGDGSEEIVRRPPLVTVISKIGMDHQGFLGDTLTKIAEQKAGIIKPGTPVIFDPSNAPEVQNVILRVAQARGSKIYQDTGPEIFISPRDENSKYSTSASRLEEVLTDSGNGSHPKHILDNAVLATMATTTALRRLNCFRPLDASIDCQGRSPLLRSAITLNDDLLNAIPQTVFPGRQQSLSIEALTGRKANILLDGAHNADSASALAENVDRIRRESEGRAVTWVLAASDTKDAVEIFRPLVRPEDKAVVVEFGPVDGMPWVKPMSVEALENALTHGLDPDGRPCSVSVVRAGSDVRFALQEASRLAQGDGSEGLWSLPGVCILWGCLETFKRC